MSTNGPNVAAAEIVFSGGREREGLHVGWGYRLQEIRPPETPDPPGSQ